MKRRWVQAFVPTLLLSSLALAAGPTNALRVSDCIRIGLENSARIARARRDQDIAEATVDQARSLALPDVSAQAVYTRLDEVQDFEFDGEVIELGSLDNYSVEGSVSQLLYSGGKVRSALRAGRVSRELANLRRHRVEQVLVRDIRIHFNAILLAAETIAVREESLAQFTALLEQTRQKQDQGTASEFDRITAQVRVRNETPKLIEAQNRHAVAMAAMQRLLGMDVAASGYVGELVFEDWRPDAQQLEQQAMQMNPLLCEARAEIDLRREDVGATRAEARPELKASATYGGANAYRFAAFQDDWEWHWNAGLSLTWDIWNGGYTSARVREKELALEKSRIDLADLRRSVRLALSEALLDMAHAREVVEAGEGSVDLAARALRIARERHAAGLGTVLEFSDAALALSEARLSQMVAIRAYRDAVTRVRYLAGQPQSDL